MLGSKITLRLLLKSQHGHLHHMASSAEYMKMFMYKYEQAKAIAHENRVGRLFMVSSCVPRVWGDSLYRTQLLQD